ALDGLALHQKILKRAPNHPMADLVYLGIARTQYSLGKKHEALNSANLGLQRALNNKNKQSALNLWVIKGDAAFDLAKASLALNSYSEADKLAKEGTLEAA